MKFGHDFSESLVAQGFPSHWIDHAIPYRQLKKCLKKVQRELLDVGLDPSTLRSLLDPELDSPVALKYRLKVSAGSNVVRPELTVHVHLRDGEIVDALLTPQTRHLFEKIAIESLNACPSSRFSSEATSPVVGKDAVHNVAAAKSDGSEELQTIEVPLVFDGEFFDMLQHDVNRLDVLRTTEQNAMTQEITMLGKEISQVAKPSRFSKSDLARWREIFELYLDAEVFFALRESAHGARSSSAALVQLQWFQSQIEERRLAQAFKLNDSRQALTRFFNLNATLVKNLLFQELNTTAIYKIMKKFDKRTSLSIAGNVPNALKSDRLLAEGVAQNICAAMSKELVSVVPQVNDYLCPICFAIAYRPVRLNCQHVFCIRCIIKIQQRQDRHCPMCRSNSVMQASADNIDRQLEHYMRKYFAREVKAKERANEMERGIENLGSSYAQSDCCVM